MSREVVYGTLVSHKGGAYALSFDKSPEKFLLLTSTDLQGIDLDLHMDGFSRWQALPIWCPTPGYGKINYEGTISRGSLRRARDLEGEFQLIKEQLQTAGMDVVLFDGKIGWIVGTRPHQRLHYDPQLRNWLCPNQRIDRLIQASVNRRTRYR